MRYQACTETLSQPCPGIVPSLYFSIPPKYLAHPPQRKVYGERGEGMWEEGKGDAFLFSDPIYKIDADIKYSLLTMLQQ